MDIFDVASNSWSNRHNLSVAREFIAAASLPKEGLALFAGGSTESGFPIASNVIDIYNARTDTMTSANLNIARTKIAATSLPAQSLVFFAGGMSFEGMLLVGVLFRFFKTVLFFLRYLLHLMMDV
jgi:hypothetical protein